jgi:hypothetical protein
MKILVIHGSPDIFHAKIVEIHGEDLLTILA